MKEDLLKIINYYGLEHQLKYIHSEYFELDEAIASNEPIDHITEEIADVMVMLKQFQYYFGITNEQIEEVMRFKIDRQLSRIGKEEEKKIPEKLDIEQDTPTSNYYIRNEYGTKCGLTKHSKIIADKLNQVIDYLKNKGE